MSIAASEPPYTTPPCPEPTGGRAISQSVAIAIWAPWTALAFAAKKEPPQRLGRLVEISTKSGSLEPGLRRLERRQGRGGRRRRRLKLLTVR
jgi:hypothetical protein